ncbi:hypothetical protein Franean1_0060 [Parafrankia sp. EAN1pec]|nr:hypothetical protein Franean1_0060 [Frankia sp. EAN1pec]
MPPWPGAVACPREQAARRSGRSPVLVLGAIRRGGRLGDVHGATLRAPRSQGQAEYCRGGGECRSDEKRELVAAVDGRERGVCGSVGRGERGQDGEPDGAAELL